MNKPILVIMAAGMGSRYGGLKQMDPIGPNGELILDYSLFDARRAGFERAIIIIKRENEKDFREVLGDRVSRHMRVDYAYQELNDLPAGFTAASLGAPVTRCFLRAGWWTRPFALSTRMITTARMPLNSATGTFPAFGTTAISPWLVIC